MGGRYTKVPTDVASHLQLNAGIITDSFNETTGEIGNILFATTGGVTFEAVPEFSDFGEDIDNMPKNMMELKRLESWEAKMSGTALEVNPEEVQRMLGAADISGIKVIPRQLLKMSDFKTLHWIGDYSEYNGETNGGFVHIELMNSLNTGGFKLKSTDKAKGNFSFEFVGHYSINAQSTVPFSISIKQGTAESGDYYITVTSVAGSSSGKTAITLSKTKTSSQSYVYQTGHNLIQPNEQQVLDGTAWTSWDGSAEITATEGQEIVVAIIDTATKKAVNSGKTNIVVAE